MDTASGFVFHVVSRITRLGAPLAIAAIALLVVALAAAITIAGLLQPASEVVLAAPIRW